MNRKNNGFTIVEMSVVVFIVGLLIVGVMAGKNLIEGGKIRAVLSEMDDNRQSMIQFQEKYFDWPGDLSNSNVLWPNSANVAGNGDEQINWTTEGVQMWRHLELAQMIGQTGFSTTVTPDAVVGTNVPGSKIAGAGWFVDYDSAAAAGSRKPLGNYLGIGAQKSSNGGNDAPALEPKQAYDIDAKVDDGNPTTGQVQSTGSGCFTGTSYNIGVTAPSCTTRFSIKNH